MRCQCLWLVSLNEIKNEYENSKNYGWSQNSPGRTVPITVDKQHKRYKIREYGQADYTDQFFRFDQKLQVVAKIVLPKSENVIQQEKKDRAKDSYDNSVAYFINKQCLIIVISWIIHLHYY